MPAAAKITHDISPSTRLRDPLPILWQVFTCPEQVRLTPRVNPLRLTIQLK